MRLPFDNVGAIGVIGDLRPESLPVDAWTRLVNVDLGYDGVTKAQADEEIYFLTVIAGTTSIQSIAHDPWFLMPVEADGITYWIYPGVNQVHAATALINRVALTRQSATSTASIDTSSVEKEYSATTGSLWSGAILAGIPLLNVDTAPPQYWYPISTSQRLQELDWDKSAGTKWSERTAGAITCETLRTYREYAIALKTTEGGTAFPRRLRWSHPAPPVTTPFTWDESKPAYDAGIHDFEETNDDLVDAEVLQGILYVYKEGTTWPVTWVGGRNILAFGTSARFKFGCFAPGCIGAMQDRHFVLTGSHMLVHDGTSYQDVGSERWERTLFGAIDSTNWRRTFVFVNEYQDAHEVWICYPSTGATWCDEALIWDYQHNTWTQRPLKGISAIAAGTVAQNVITTWSPDTQAWDADQSSWNESASDPRQFVPVAAMPDQGGFLLSKRLWRVKSQYEDYIGGSIGGENASVPYQKVTSIVERIGLPLAGQRRDGTPKTGVLRRYLINEVWPRIRAPDGTVVNVTLGFQETLQDAVVWGTSRAFTVGTSLFTEHYAEGRIPSIRFETDAAVRWTLMGYELDIQPAGEY